MKTIVCACCGKESESGDMHDECWYDFLLECWKEKITLRQILPDPRAKRPLVTITVQARSIRAGDRLITGSSMRVIEKTDYTLRSIVQLQLNGGDVLGLPQDQTVTLVHSYLDSDGSVWTVDRSSSAVVAQWKLTVGGDKL